MKNKKVRVRFAPAPTGMMHLGNVRAALMNYLFALQKDGTFVLRIEDTDPERNYDPQGTKIIEDLDWLNLSYNEGPLKGGPHAPYIQSERTDLYTQKLEQLHKEHKIYRCFCTQEELEKKRDRQKALKMPPRYDRTCLNLSEKEIEDRLAKKTPFIWRFKLDHAKIITITDMARGPITFELKNFSDFPITRQNGTFTFMFANTIDDIDMAMTHVMRGEDHLTNTAGQAALMDTLGAALPIFFHMPILCNTLGKKLSKRDFGFSLRDLKAAGFVPEAICNYLAILGGSFEQEIMSLAELASAYDFSTIHSTGHIKYDVEKLRWINHKWLSQYDSLALAHACRPFLAQAYSTATNIDNQELARILQLIKTDLVTLTDSVEALKFYFEKPTVTEEVVAQEINAEQRATIKQITRDAAQTDSIEDLTSLAKQKAKELNIPLRQLFTFMRLCLTGKPKGPSIHDSIEILGLAEAQERLLAHCN